MFINTSCYENKITFIARDLFKDKQAGDITHTANFTLHLFIFILRIDLQVARTTYTVGQT